MTVSQPLSSSIEVFITGFSDCFQIIHEYPMFVCFMDGDVFHFHM